MKKTVRVGTIESYGKHKVSVYCSIKFENGKLSISGVEGPLPSGNAIGGCGQIDMGYAHRDSKDNDPRYDEPKQIAKFAEGWNQETWFKFLDIWHRWHLNDMKAECEHQRQRGETWETHPSATCPDCGYVLGSAWLREEVPADVIEFLQSLPDADQVPAWV
jgi:hypothetical protein